MKTTIQKRGVGGSLRPFLLNSAAAMVGIAGLLPASVRAQTAEPAAADAEESKGLDDIVVTADRRSKGISQVPISVQAITPTQITRMGAADTTALTQLSPSITFRPGFSANSSSFAIRGVTSVAINGGLQPSTSFVVDGMPLYRQGEFLTDLADLQGIEILRGPQGTLFGKNSSAGVVNITTNSPQKEFAGKIGVGATTDEEYWANGAVNLPIGDTVQARFSGFYRDQNPLVKNQGSANDQIGAETYGFNVKVNFNVTDDIDLLLSIARAKRTSSYGQAFIITPTGATQAAAAGTTLATYGYGNTYLGTNGESIEEVSTTSFVGQFDWRISDNTTLTSITGYRKYNSDNKNDVDATRAGADLGQPLAPVFNNFLAVNSGFPRQPGRLSYGSQELRLHYEGEKADLVTGVFYQTVKENVKSNTGLIGFFRAGAGDFNQYYNNTFSDVTIKNDSAAIFADLTYKLTDTFSVFGGARYTHETLSNNYARTTFLVLASRYNSVTGVVNTASPLPGEVLVVAPSAFLASGTTDNVSGRVGLQWQPSEGQNYYASYNRGYKGPATNAGSAAALATAIVAPEIADAFEIGTKQRLFDNRLSLGLSLYSQKISDIQQSAVIPGTVTSALASAGDLKSKGVEFEFQALITSGLRLSGGIAYTDAKYSGPVGNADCYTGQTLAQGCIPVPGGGAATYQLLDGQVAINAPKVRYNMAVDYVVPVGSLGKIEANVAYSWSGKTQYALNHGPNTVEPSHGFLNASLTLVTDAGFELQVFGRNLTNEFYYGTRSDVPFVFGNSGYIPRDFKRYFGVSGKFNF